MVPVKNGEEVRGRLIPTLASIGFPTEIPVENKPVPATRVVIVPKLVREDAVTPAARVEPVRVDAAAVTVILALPSKEVPLMVLGVCKAVAVPAFPEIVDWSPVLVPLTVASKGTVKVLEVVPPEMEKPVGRAVRVKPL